MFVIEFIDIFFLDVFMFKIIYNVLKGESVCYVYQWKFVKNVLWFDNWEKEGSGVVFDFNGLLVIELELILQLSYEVVQQWVLMDVDICVLLFNVDDKELIGDVVDVIVKVFKQYIGFDLVMVY